MFCLIHLLIHTSVELEKTKNLSYDITLTIFGCFSGYFLSISISFVLFSLVLLIQIRYNLQQQQIHFIDNNITKAYLLNVALILYITGCPMNARQEEPNHYLCSIIVILVILQYWILWKLSKRPIVQYRQIITGKQSSDLYKQIVLTVFLKLVDHNCSIC